MTGAQPAINEDSWSFRAAAWADRNSARLIIGTVILTALLVIPLSVLDAPDEASQNPEGKVFDLQGQIDEVFAAPAHWIPLIAEAHDGDMLTPQNLKELLLSETTLRAEDARGNLIPEDLGSGPALLSYFDNTTNRNVLGVVTIADAVESYLQASTGGAVSLAGATEEQVKIAVHDVLAAPETEELREFLSIHATAEPYTTTDGREILWWESPAIQLNVIADNDTLGGGTQAIGISTDDNTVDKEEFNRNVQEVLRRDIEGYDIWGIAIDVNLESADQGEESGIYITFTVIAAIAIVGISLRSYWAVALTGIGLGALMIWLKGISLLVGIKGGLVIDLIVPIAMVSLGVDFAVHAIRRYQEERRAITVPRRAFVIGLGAVLPALLLAMASDSIAFLSNSTAGIEAVVHFGFAASIATASSFLVLGVVVPQAYARIDGLLTGRSYSGRAHAANRIFSSFGVASAAGGSVILLIVLSAAAGAAFLAVTLLFAVLIPVLILRRQAAGNADERDLDHPGKAMRSDHESHSFDRLAALLRYRFAVAAVAIGVTAIAAVFALRLDATFDVKDFFSSSSDFAVSLDKLDEHVGDRSGEPAAILIEGDLTDPTVLPAIPGVFDNLDGNQNLGRDTQGVVNISEPNLIQIVLDITASPAGRAGVLELTGVEIPEDPPYGTPPEQFQIDAVLDYAVQAGVPTTDGEVKYTPDRVQSALSHNPLGRTQGVTQFTVFIPGTREQSAVVEARDSIERDLQTLAGVSAITDYGVTGSPMIRQAQLEATTESLQRSIPIAAVAAFLLLFVSFRSVRFALITIIPIGLVVVWLYAIMYISGFALNFVTATIGAVSIGVGIDFSIHLTQRFREELNYARTKFIAMQRALRGTGVALAGSSASSIVGFAIMGFAPMPLFSSYGILTSIMVFLAVFAALIVLPSLLMIVTPEPEPVTDIQIKDQQPA